MFFTQKEKLTVQDFLVEKNCSNEAEELEIRKYLTLSAPFGLFRPLQNWFKDAKLEFHMNPPYNVQTDSS